MIELEVKNLNKRFGGLHVLKDVTFGIKGAELIGLIGPNGAGKTTLTNILDGAIKPSSGTVYLNGQRIDQLAPFEVAKVGLGRTFQVTRSFRRMTVLENLYVPALAKHVSADKSEVTNKALEVLEFLTMNHLRNEYAQALSGGQQKLLELAMALMNEPEMLLLDEPTAGINPTLINGIIDRLIKVNQDFGITLLVIEHNMRVIMQLAESIYCLAHGKMLANGTPDEIKNDKRVIDAYLGAQ